MPTINGTTGNDTLTGTAGDDVIGALAGDDIVNALDGNDTVFASTGNDTISGGGGNDYVIAAEGDDIVNGDDGDDILSGGVGNDIVDGGAGNDTLTVRNDQFAGSDFSSGDQFIGGSGSDTIVFNGDFTYGFVGFDLTSTAMSGIEMLIADLPVFLTVAQLAQFSTLQGIIRVVGSGTIDLSNNRFASGALYLGSGNDIVTMGTGTSTGYVNLYGGGGDDQIIANDSANSLDGGDGNDRLEGRGGGDSLSGGAGNDILLGGDGDDTLSDSFGDDILDGGTGNDTFFVDPQAGFSTADQIIGGTGYDTLYIASSGQVTDWLTLAQISGIDRLSGGNSRFIMTVAEATQFDLLELGTLQLSTAGNLTVGSAIKVYDFVLSGLGNGLDLSASIYGARVIGGAGNDTITGSLYIDDLAGGGGDDIINGGGGGDTLSGGAGADWLNGGNGDDTLNVAIGEAVTAGDRFTGGSGDDRLFVAFDPYASVLTDLSLATIDSDIESLQGGRVRLTIGQIDNLASISLNQLHIANGGSLDLTGQSISGYYLYLSDAGNNVTLGTTSFYEVQGGTGSDSIIGTALSDRLLGGAGNDILTGGGGGDFIIGQAGADTMIGGSGDDWYDVDDAGDVVVELAGEGIDFIYSAIGYVLPANVENLSLYGEASVNVTGNDLANRLGGNSGNNILDGQAGADVMAGGNGNDTYYVDNIGDVVDENGQTGIDTVYSSVDFTLSVFTENLTLTGTAALNGTGGAFDNLIIGNSASNIIDGAGGADTMQGGGGDDLYFVDDGNDRVIEAAGGGFDQVITAFDFTIGANVEELTLVGTYDSAGNGNEPAYCASVGNSDRSGIRHGSELFARQPSESTKTGVMKRVAIRTAFRS